MDSCSKCFYNHSVLFVLIFNGYKTVIMNQFVYCAIKHLIMAVSSDYVVLVSNIIIMRYIYCYSQL